MFEGYFDNNGNSISFEFSWAETVKTVKSDCCSYGSIIYISMYELESNWQSMQCSKPLLFSLYQNGTMGQSSQSID